MDNNYEALAQRIDLPLLSPALTDDDIVHGIHVASQQGLRCVVVRPSDIELAARCANNAIAIGSVLDHPYGYSTTAAKQYAVRDLLRRGAKEIETPINFSKLVSRQFQYLETELQQISQPCQEAGAIFKVSIDASLLTEEFIMLSCRILRRARVDFLSTNTIASVPLIRAHSRERLQIKLYSGIDGLDAALAACDSGCSRIEVSGVVALLEAWKEKAATAGEPATRLN